MKIAPLVFACAGLACAAWTGAPRDDSNWTFLISGDSDGNLSPCGCTSPMTGGLRRRATAVRKLSVGDRTIVLDNGDNVAGTARQDELKAESVAEILGRDCNAIAFKASEAKLGIGEMQTLQRLSKGNYVSSNLREGATNPLMRTIEAGDFLIGSVAASESPFNRLAGVEPESSARAIEQLVSDAENVGRSAVLLYSGNRDQAESVARSHPTIKIIVYRSPNDPPKAVETVGTTTLVTPGEHGKYLLRLTMGQTEVKSYTPISLGPEFEDQADASRLYRTYLDRVDREDLLSKLPKSSSPKFVGSTKCGSCHAPDFKVWKLSAHSHALKTLENDGHGRDPDCVSCHVTGLEKKGGFFSHAKTPLLAMVGCESCHGAGATHSAAPRKVKMPKVGESHCIKCHTPSNSPNFEFLTYWNKIRHGKRG